MNPVLFDPPMAAILRGLTPAEAPVVGEVLFGAGFRLLEVPLNRPLALECIAILAELKPADALVGGGTMLTKADVDGVYAAGGRLMVAPNCDPGVIAHAASLNMLTAPGVATPTEALAALAAGAKVLKIFPAEMVGYGGLKAMKAVLPPDTPLWPVGGVTPANMAQWLQAGATGFGIGSQLYKPGQGRESLELGAAEFIAAWQERPR
ncbi:2-dehydro-3-deoxy-6-phosphogalactonate aldolase [Pseudoduganella ginsengisoli]|uniref:2-dehydro-3-deoxy-6-phosphogalactonate aldolase n=1 Tax=Pseudoduganella ginsengisoli TaxID=1462440 RepID=A0A6L6PWF6_9BURK|nr:2-dehydro-3-deoxy-6-phosphogalactonate aldolase [Pseudoduganella ginsengisoli]MTW01569.1 2-dehydro-3-deoxy-6-phosphogalactonate aldolase [Pseudoduganella ginsengisoli]